MLERLQIDDSRFFVQHPHECTFGALLMAATFGALHCVRTIVDTNPELVRTRESGAEILHCVSPCHLFSGQILRFLLSRGARVDAPTMTPVKTRYVYAPGQRRACLLPL